MKSLNLNAKIIEIYKMKLFRELVKLIWNDEINQVEKLPQKILNENIQNKFDKQTIVNSVINHACKYCDKDNKKDKECLIRDKHINCNEKNIESDTKFVGVKF